ncbi:DNA mismatch repair endonuclease MutL [Candidatus Woesearchaeota archaeon]|nr:DNA mismatch repair endonuclease MutL [Candidatus Woesearchaeota archaeon]
MPKIKLLEEALINQIAAGEVIERPASVVKELVENAIDAGATEITIEADEGGKSRIKVTDNGSGMEKEDALLCLERHATSKISTADDLFKINTLGFRGEALASIAAISELVLKTKTKEKETGTKILVSAGKILEVEEAAMQDGTSIEITSLFFNVPARKKHLKTIQTELRQITELLTKYALIYTDKTIEFLHHGQSLLLSHATKNPLDTILTIYGKKVAYAMLAVNSTYTDITVKGFISKPTLTRADKEIQHIFINTRAVKNNIISKAVYDAYHTLLHLENHPLFILSVTINPQIIDVNVHPQKALIRVEKENELYTAIFNAIRNTLDNAKLMPTMEQESIKQNQSSIAAKQFSIVEEKQTFLKKEEEISLSASAQEMLERALQKVQEGKTEQKEKQEEPLTTQTPAVASSQRISTMRLIGRIHNTFYIAENELGLVIIDQHAAHERVMYEKFMEQLYEKKVSVQELLVPEEVEFSPAEMLTLKENEVPLEQLGFQFEEFGRNTMLLRTVPMVLGRFVDKEVIHEILANITDKSSVDIKKEEKIIRSACRAAVKAHDIVHTQEMHTIMEQLQKCKQPFTCPHGRPTMIQMSIPELEKKFKRVV